MEDLLLRREEIEQELNDEPDRHERKSRSELLLEHLNAINKALGLDFVVQDPLWDYWEAELAAGRMPDLDMTVEDLEELKRQEKIERMVAQQSL